VWNGQNNAHRILLAFAADETGQVVVEYRLLMGTIAVVVLAGTMSFGIQVSPWFGLLAARITSQGT
jgi:Flp pilus assembly pilin Flp